jgi:hypothetical protein
LKGIAMADIDSTLLHQLFEYKDGFLVHKNTKSWNAKSGQRTGYLNKIGYEVTVVNKKRYYNHRLIFMMFYGYMPKIIDHIDKNPANNCIENLREASRSQNNQNSKKPKSNTSGYKNVDWHIRRKKWRVKLKVNKKIIYIGHFDDIELANLVAIEARNKYHGEFARHK